MGMKRDSAGSVGWSARAICCWCRLPGCRRGRGRVGSGRLVLAEGEATGHAHVVDDERASLHRLVIAGGRRRGI